MHVASPDLLPKPRANLNFRDFLTFTHTRTPAPLMPEVALVLLPPQKDDLSSEGAKCA